MLDATKRVVVPVRIARQMSVEGEWKPNPHYDPLNHHDPRAQQKMLFHARYSLMWRPDPNVPESAQYAYAWEVN